MLLLYLDGILGKNFLGHTSFSLGILPLCQCLLALNFARNSEANLILPHIYRDLFFNLLFCLKNYFFIL